jgi:hypothetical protein
MPYLVPTLEIVRPLQRGRIYGDNLVYTLIVEFTSRILGVDVCNTHLRVLVSAGNSHDYITIYGHRKHSKTTIINVFTNQIYASR